MGDDQNPWHCGCAWYFLFPKSSLISRPISAMFSRSRPDSGSSSRMSRDAVPIIASNSLRFDLAAGETIVDVAVEEISQVGAAARTVTTPDGSYLSWRLKPRAS